MSLHLKFSFDNLPFALTSLSLVSSLACSPCSLSFARNARPFFLFVFAPLHFDSSRSFPCSYARPARSHSLAELAPSYLSLALARHPLRQCSPCSFSFARTARPFPLMRFSFFILNIPFLSYKFYPLLIDHSRSYPHSIPLARSLARMLARSLRSPLLTCPLLSLVTLTSVLALLVLVRSLRSPLPLTLLLLLHLQHSISFTKLLPFAH